MDSVDLFKPTSSGKILTIGNCIDKELKDMPPTERKKLREYIKSCLARYFGNFRAESNERKR